jgi:ATP-binding cassette subfamily B multidrug efflux pump
MQYVTPYRGAFLYLAAFLTVFLAVVALAQPILMQKAVDDYIVVGNYNGLVFIVVLMVVFSSWYPNHCAVLPNLYD